MWTRLAGWMEDGRTAADGLDAYLQPCGMKFIYLYREVRQLQTCGVLVIVVCSLFHPRFLLNL